MNTPRVMESAYMQWAKEHVRVGCNLAISGLMSYPLSLLPVTMADLEITGNSFYGYPPLQEALARHCGTTADRVFASIGTSLANHIAMAVLAAPGEEILVEEPGYELIVAAAGYLGLSVRRFPRRREEGFAVDPQEIARRLTPKTRLVVLTNLHNPSSAFLDEATLAEVGRAAARAGARVLVDEVYLDAAFDRNARSAAHLGPQFVVTSSLTKVYGLSGLRCGWVVAPPELVTKMWHLNDLYSGIPSHATERMSVVALEHLPHIRAWARAILDENRARAQELLLDRADIECFFPDAGTVLFPRLKKGTVEALYRRLMERYDTAIAPGRFFGLEDHFRVGLGGKPEVFLQGLRNLCSALDTLPG